MSVGCMTIGQQEQVINRRKQIMQHKRKTDFNFSMQVCKKKMKNLSRS